MGLLTPCTLFVVCFVAAVDQPLPTAAELSAALHSHQSACSALQFQFTLEYEHLRAKAPDGTLHELTPHPPRIYEWLSSDNRARLTSPLLPASATEPARAPLFVSFDGTNGFQVFCWNLHPDVPSTITQRDERPTELNSCWPLMCLGWQLPLDARELSECLTLPQTRVRGWSDVDGVNCVEVDVPDVTHHGKVVGFLRCWLDPAVGWLPRRWVVFPMRWHNELPAEGSRQQLEAGEMCVVGEVLNYIPVTNRLSGTEMQFPGETRSDGMHCHIAAASVLWNPSLDIALFRPEMTPGAKLEIHRGDQVVKSRVLGSEADRARHQQYVDEAAEYAKKQAEQSRSETPAAAQASATVGPLATAVVPAGESPLWQVSLLLGVILLASGLGLWRFRGRST